ncbi:hypothetical protein CL630_01550 [bacterium]|nr:hypothetical protein [bacterium]|tara:strand:- start:7805 stop:8368 length:564 start_codon:yes stop_codon:yes gene_type:complete
MNIPKLILEKISSLKTPVIIGVSGLGGVGKSTFATSLGEIIHAPIVGVDSFMKDRPTEDYSLWEIMDFPRLEKEVLKPMLANKTTFSYGHFDWEQNGIIGRREIKHQGLLIVEGVGLFRPELKKYLKLTIWVDCPVEEAINRGKKRDREEYQNPQDEYWDTIWKKNDQEYLEAYHPEKTADIIVNNC